MTAPIAALPLARLITKHAYLAGAGLVTTFYADEDATLPAISMPRTKASTAPAPGSMRAWPRPMPMVRPASPFPATIR